MTFWQGPFLFVSLYSKKNGVGQALPSDKIPGMVLVIDACTKWSMHTLTGSMHTPVEHVYTSVQHVHTSVEPVMVKPM